MIQILWPWVFALLPLPWLCHRLLPRAANKDASLYVPFFRSLSRIETVSPRVGARNRLLALLAIIAWLLLVIAASRPQWIGEPIQLPTTGRDLMLPWIFPAPWKPRIFNWAGRMPHAFRWLNQWWVILSKDVPAIALD